MKFKKTSKNLRKQDVKAANDEAISDKDFMDAKDITRDEATTLIKKAEKSEGISRQTIYGLKIRNAHTAFGLEHWRQFAQEHLSKVGNPKHVDRLFRAAQVEVNLKVPIGTIAESTTRKLYPMKDDGVLHDIWDGLMSKVENGKYPTAAEIEKAIDAYEYSRKMIEFIKNEANPKQRKEIAIALINACGAKSLSSMKARINERMKKMEPKAKGANKPLYSTDK